MLRRSDRLRSGRSVRARPPALAMACSHLNAMSFMQPRTLRFAVLASRTSCWPRSPNVPAGSSSRRSSRPMRPVTSWRVARKPDAVTSASKMVNSVAEWVSSRHVRRSDRNRFACQSSGSGAGAGPAAAGPRTVRSFLVHRRITVRSYGVEPRAGGPVLPLPVRRLRASASRPVRDNPDLYYRTTCCLPRQSPRVHLRRPAILGERRSRDRARPAGAPRLSASGRRARRLGSSGWSRRPGGVNLRRWRGPADLCVYTISGTLRAWTTARLN